MLFSSSAQRWEILKKHVELSIKSQSDTRWESRIKCIKPLRYNLKEVLLALKDLEAISIERKDGRAASETKSLIAHLSKWSFLLSVFIWYDILFQVNKASKILQSYGVSLHTMETEIQATEKFLQNYRTTGYDSAATSAVEIAQELDIDPSFPPSRSGKKRRLFDYQGEEEQRATPELKFKSNFFYPLVDQAIMSIKERFNLLREVSSAFSFLFTRDKLLLVQQENALLTCCKEFQKKFGDIDSDEMSAELQRFVLILQKKRNLNTAQDFLNYLLKTHLFELYPNVYIALRILLTCPVTVASAERSFSKLKLIKTFNRTSMTDSRLSSLAMLSIENDCARSLDYDNVITAFANKKVLHQSTAASKWWWGPRPRLGWVEMAVGLPEDPSYPGHSPFIFSLCCPLNDRRRAAHSIFKIGRLFLLFLLSCPTLALLRLLILLLLLMSGNVHPNPGPIFPCSVCAGNVTWRGKSVQCCACSKWVHLRCSQLSLSNFRALGSSHSWSCPPAVTL